MELSKDKKDELLNTHLLNYNMPAVEDLAGLTITELEFLMKSAEVYHEKKSFPGDNFIKKTEVFREAVTRALKEQARMYVAWDVNTGYPHVMGDGTLMIFSEEEYAIKAKEHYEELGLKLDMKIIPKDKQPLFWADCHWWGMENMTMDVGSFTASFTRGAMLPPPDFTDVPKQSIPVTNPALVFALVRHRQLLFETDKNEQWKKAEQFLCNKMLKEIVKAKYLCPVQVDKAKEDVPDENGKVTLSKDTTIRFAGLTDKENQKWLPAFSDWQTFQKIYHKDEWNAQIVTYNDLISLSKDTGIVINPGGMETRLDENRKKILVGYDARHKRLTAEMESGLLKECKPGLYLGESVESMDALKEVLMAQLKKQKEVKKAYLMIKVERVDDISYLLVVEFKGERKEVFGGIAEAVKSSLGSMRMDMHEADAKMMELIGEMKPFYKKSFLGL